MGRRRCTTPYCPAPAEPGSPKCQQHRRQSTRYKKTPTPNNLYKTQAWAKLRTQVLDEERICHGWPNPGHPCGHPTTDVDHITPITAGGATLARVNLHALCHACHSRKTMHERRQRGEMTGHG